MKSLPEKIYSQEETLRINVLMRWYNIQEVTEAISILETGKLKYRNNEIYASIEQKSISVLGITCDDLPHAKRIVDAANH